MVSRKHTVEVQFRAKLDGTENLEDLEPMRNTATTKVTPTTKDRAVDLVARGALGLALLLPYETRVRIFGWFFSAIVARVAGWRRRIENNLEIALPELGRAERATLMRKVSDNVGRCLIEMYSGEEFLQRIENSPLSGPGLAALEEAHASKRPVVLLTAHLGSYDAARGTLRRRGYKIAGLYKRMANRAFNAHYVKAMSVFGEPLFPTDRKGIVGLARHLRAGGKIGILADVRWNKAPLLSFFGHPAHTSLSAAEWAVQYDALLLPVFGIRQDDGFSFEVRLEEPIPLGKPEEMMQRYNDTVEAIVREYPSQWFWIHNRWKLAGWARESVANFSVAQSQRRHAATALDPDTVNAAVESNWDP